MVCFMKSLGVGEVAGISERTGGIVFSMQSGVTKTVRQR